MIDIEIVKERYARMTDDQLIHLLKTEAKEILPEARQLLEQEFMTRNMDVSYFDTLREEEILEQKQNYEQLKVNLATVYTNSLFEYAFLMKQEEKTNREILNGLSKKGLDPEQSLLVLERLEPGIKHQLSLYNTQIRMGAIIFGVGSLVTFLSYTSASGSGPYVIAWGAIAFGAICFFKALVGKEKYQKVFDAIQAEKENEVSTGQ